MTKRVPLDPIVAGDLQSLRVHLRAARLRQKMTQTRVARALHITQANVSRVEIGGGADARIRTLARMASVLGVQLRISVEPRRHEGT